MVALGVALGLSACASTEPATAPVQASAPVVRPAAVVLSEMERRAQAALAQANKQFAAGDFKGVISGLNTNKAIDFSSTATQVQAHKLLAFSYCIAKRTALCNAEFARVMQLDPGFTLPEAERSHPMWGPAFETARKKASMSVSSATKP